MDKDRVVAGLDVHIDSVFCVSCAMTRSLFFEKTYGTLTLFSIWL